MIENKPVSNEAYEFDPKNPSSDALAMAKDEDLRRTSMEWLMQVRRYRYVYGWKWLGRPIIQHPQDIMAIQEIIWQVRPDLILETGIAHGGSLALSATILEILGGDRQVLGIDIDIRSHNRVEIEKHPLAHRIRMIEGSSVDDAIAKQVHEIAQGKGSVLVILDSMHTHDHVLRELELYSPLVKSGGYLIVMDTTIEDLPDELFGDRPWGKGNNPKTAVRKFLKSNDRFVVDEVLEGRLVVSVATGGYLKCVKD